MFSEILEATLCLVVTSNFHPEILVPQANQPKGIHYKTVTQIEFQLFQSNDKRHLLCNEMALKVVSHQSSNPINGPYMCRRKNSWLTSMTLGLQSEKASYKKEIEPTGIIHRENI